MRKIKLTNKKAKLQSSAIEAETPVTAEPVIIEAAPVTEAPAEQKPVASIPKHDIATAYAGPSKPFTNRVSRTAIQAEFNAYPNAALTARDCAFLDGLKRQYAGAEFPRLNADAGNLRRAIERGFLNYGEALNSFVLTEKALTSRFV